MSSAHRHPHLSDHHSHQGMSCNVVGRPPSGREASSQNHPWQLVQGRRAARAEKREARVSLERSSMWVIPITSRIPGCATNANSIPLGFRANTYGPGHPLRKPQHSSHPHTYRAEGYRRPAMDGGRAMPYHGPKLVNSMPVSKLGNSLHHESKNVTRSEGALAVINPDPDCIKILNPKEAMELSKYCRGHELFAKWRGNNQPLAEIVEWWKTTFHSQVSITTLANNFLYIECYNKSLKAKLLHEEYVFTKVQISISLNGNLNSMLIDMNSKQYQNG
ncbi:hypothetical protein SUGI_0270740 [Cryptomeria japonica]|nr:hypothetical protein SUGI_0270740 [Cryptomeria japonica]